MNYFLWSIAFLAIGGKMPATKTKLFALPVQSWISYDGFHILHTWKGITKDVNCVITYNTGNQTIEAVAASAKLLNFNSKNINRDSHGLEMLDALVFPKVNFTSASVATTEEGLKINGLLNLHGVTKSITVDAKTSLSGSKMRIEGSFPIQLGDYNITIPALLGINIKEKIQVSFTFVFDIDQ